MWNNTLECCLLEEGREAKRINRAINKQLKKDKHLSKKEMKLLILGMGESGKSTFIKQMRILHGKEYSNDEKRRFINLVYQNIFMAMQSMIHAMEVLQIMYADPSCITKAELINDVNYREVTSFENQFVDAIRDLWSDLGIQNCYNRRREYHLTDSARYFLDDLDRLTDQNYLPTEQDILRVRVPTNGINEYIFNVNRYVFRMVDVAGQRTERRKWIYCFQNVTCLIYLVAINDYDQVHLEDNTNYLVESTSLFDLLINYQLFENKEVLLFLNKKDLLREKIVNSHLADYFPDYIGPREDYEAARTFIKQQFVRLNNNENRTIYSHFTCATDTENIRTVFAAVQNIIIDKYLGDYNLA